MRRVVDLLLTQPVDARGEHVGQLVRAELGEDTALLALLTEVAHGAVSELTRERVALALEAAAQSNAAFGQALDAAVMDGGLPLPTAVPAVLGTSAMYAVVADDVDVVTDLFFGRDDAEHDLADGLLRLGFLSVTAYSEVVAGRKNLIIGRKGSGKSAICMWLIENDFGSDSACLITPDDAAGEELRRFELSGLTSPSAKALLWRYVIAVHAARYLVRHTDTHSRRRPSSVARLERFLRDNNELVDTSLYHRIARAGRGLVSSMSLEAFGVTIAVDANGTPEGVRAGQQLEVLESGVLQAFDELGCSREHGAMLVLVDQLEQVWSGEPESAALVVGLLLAGKHTALRYRGAVRCVSFLRSDIYDSLDFGDADKFHSDEIRITWTENLLHRLALTRAGAALGRHLTPEELWGEVFPAVVDGEPTADYLLSRILPRPRDAIQFLNQCRDTALDNGHRRITESDVLEATLVFSRWKRGDLGKEYGIRFPYLDALLVVFRDAGHEQTRTSIAELFLPFQEDLRIRFGDHDAYFDPDAIIELLFSVGFLGVRRRQGWIYTGTGEPTIQPHESEFCIHPCFRPALNATTPHSPRIRNTITGTHVGTAIQVGAIQGGIHIHGHFAGGDANTTGPSEPPETGG